MTAVQFNNSASVTDRRRRRLVVDMEPEVADINADSQVSQGENEGGSSAFPMLTRDRLIRRIISPRLWKHLVVAIVLTLTPIFFAIAAWSSKQSLETSLTFKSQLDALRGLSGLKLFAAAQFCLVIGWVRSASAVDFHGRYRWWRWMAVGLFAASFILLTGSTEFFISIVAQALQPVFGRIDAARPALIIVPAGAGLALVLRRLIPDMGRCRLAQSLVVCSTLLLIARAFAGARLNSAADVFHLSIFELLISGLLLSAFQLHARYVIHVNPNPPLSIGRKVFHDSRYSAAASTATMILDEIAPEGESEITESGNRQGLSGEISVNKSETIATLNSTNLPTPFTEPGESETKPAEIETKLNSHSASPSTAKSNKKQKFRKAG